MDSGIRRNDVGNMVAAGSAEEFTRDADGDADAEPAEWFQDAGLFEKWIREENAIILYGLTRREGEALRALNIRDVAGFEERYRDIYRGCLIGLRQGEWNRRLAQRRKDAKEEPERKEAAV